VSFGIDQRNAEGERVFGVNVANVNLKADLYNNVDLQLVVENCVYQQVRADGVTARQVWLWRSDHAAQGELVRKRWWHYGICRDALRVAEASGGTQNCRA
jgi:hypothetical protein